VLSLDHFFLPSNSLQLKRLCWCNAMTRLSADIPENMVRRCIATRKVESANHGTKPNLLYGPKEDSLLKTIVAALPLMSPVVLFRTLLYETDAAAILLKTLPDETDSAAPCFAV